MNRGIVICLALVISVGATPVGADERPGMRAINITAQAGLTVISAVVQGKIRGWRDVLQCLSSGAASGYGFYEGKALIGNGHVQAGSIVANLAGSLAENAASGKHPFSQLGYSIGPVRFRISMPRLDRQSDSWVHVDISAFQGAALIVAARRGDRVEWRGGLIAFRRETPFPNGESGITYGLFPTLFDTGDSTWRHEAIHALQFLQLDVVEPSIGFLNLSGERPTGSVRRFVRVEHLKIGVVNLANLAVVLNQPYHHRWVEVEAYRLAGNTNPPR